MDIGISLTANADLRMHSLKMFENKIDFSITELKKFEFYLSNEIVAKLALYLFTNFL